MATLYDKRADRKKEEPTRGDHAVLTYLEKEHLDYYDERISDEASFAIWYQLSGLRTGLLGWYSFKPDGSVLEVGAGFGALTGILCERCKKVVATERSYVRAKAISDRWQEKENLQVYAGEWSEIDFEEKFDYIVLTGILERVGGGRTDEAVYSAYLQRLKGLLKEDGVLLLAVENRFGLKYFCGVKEPHVNRAFAGINQYPGGTKGYSFSRQEIADIVKTAGFARNKFYYPLPDYKLPQLIYSDEYLPDASLNERLIPYYVDKNSVIAWEKDLYGDVVKNGVFPFFANSFLVECGKEENFDKTVYATVSTDRGKEKAYATVIYNDKTVSKKAMFPEGKKNAEQLCRNMADLKAHDIPLVVYKEQENGIRMPYMQLPTLSNYLKELIGKDKQAFLGILDRLYKTILQSSEVVSKEENALLPILTEQITEEAEKKELSGVDFGPILAKAYIELIPLNCFFDEKKESYLYFDQEYVRENYPAKYTMFRAIHYIYCFTSGAEKIIPKEELISRYRMEASWKYFVMEEKRFLDEVRNRGKYRQFYHWAQMNRAIIDRNLERLKSEEEKIAEYRVSDKMKRTWQVELAMLDEVQRICKKYDLTYFFVHGSLLGAVRHRGFIPWDDDLDIAMPRQDYDRFLECAKAELQKPLSLHTPATETQLYWGGHTRIRNENTAAIGTMDLGHEGNQGIWIDILPLDVCTADENKFLKKQKRIRHCHRLLYAKTYGKESIKRHMDMNSLHWFCYKLLAGIYSRQTLCDKLNAAMKLYTEEASDEVAVFSGYFKHRRLNAKDFAGTEWLVFENRSVPVPVGYENYLFMTLGKDYMKYPPEEERKPKHAGIFDPDMSYADYNDKLSGIFDGAKGKQVILFGAGMMFEDYMKNWGNKCRPAFLVDNDENKWGRRRMGIEIKAPDAIKEVPEGKRHLIICSFYYREITKQLEEMGIHDYKVYIQNVEWILETERKRK